MGPTEHRPAAADRRSGSPVSPREASDLEPMIQLPDLLQFKWSGRPLWDFVALKQSTVPHQKTSVSMASICTECSTAWGPERSLGLLWSPGSQRGAGTFQE